MCVPVWHPGMGAGEHLRVGDLVPLTSSGLSLHYLGHWTGGVGLGVAGMGQLHALLHLFKVQASGFSLSGANYIPLPSGDLAGGNLSLVTDQDELGWEHPL